MFCWSLSSSLTAWNSQLVFTEISQQTYSFWRRINTPLPAFLVSDFLSLRYTVYSGGKISLLLISGLSQDSVPRTRSGSVTDKNVWNSWILFTMELQLRTLFLALQNAFLSSSDRDFLHTFSFFRLSILAVLILSLNPRTGVWSGREHDRRGAWVSNNVRC